MAYAICMQICEGMPVRVPSAWLLLGFAAAASACTASIAAARTVLSGEEAIAKSAGSTLWNAALVSAALWAFLGATALSSSNRSICTCTSCP